MSNTYYMTVHEVAAELGISTSYAYKLVHKMNEELKAMHCITMAGRVDRAYFHEHIYATKENKEETNGSV